MRSALQKFLSASLEGRKAVPGAEDWQDGLHWSSLVLPYVESLWAAGEYGLASQVIQAIAERVYTSVDRRSVANPSAEGKPLASGEKLGWPGVSCEVWGGHGAYGGEGYGWGAVLPAHIIRSLLGFRDPRQPDELPLAPNLPDSFMVSGRAYRIVNLQYRGALLELAIHVLDPQRVRVEGTWSGSVRSIAVKDGRGANVALQGTGSAWQFEGGNHQQYLVRIVGISKA